MNTEEKKELELLREEVNRLREEVDRLTKMNVSLAAGSESLLKRNMDLYRRLDSYYNVRMRVNWLKDLIRRHREMIANADLRDDDELRVSVHQGWDDRVDQVKSLLIRQAGDQADDKHVVVLDQAQLLL